MRKVSAAIIFIMVILCSTASAKSAPVCTKAYGVRMAVIAKHNKRAPGRNICRYGVRHSDGTIVPAKYSQKKRYLFQLRVLTNPVPYLNVSAVPPSQLPAGTLSASYSPSGLAACIVRVESGGNPTADNGTHQGIAQWSPEAWERHGGKQYASTPAGATYQQQLQVLSNGLARYGCADWCPFDPC